MPGRWTATSSPAGSGSSRGWPVPTRSQRAQASCSSAPRALPASCPRCPLLQPPTPAQPSPPLMVASPPGSANPVSVCGDCAETCTAESRLTTSGAQATTSPHHKRHLSPCLAGQAPSPFWSESHHFRRSAGVTCDWLLTLPEAHPRRRSQCHLLHWTHTVDVSPPPEPHSETLR